MVAGDAVLTSPTLGLSLLLEVTPTPGLQIQMLSYVWTRYGMGWVSRTVTT